LAKHQANIVSPFTQVAVDLIMFFPFAAAACAIAMSTRAVARGEVVTSSRMFARRTLRRSTNPIEFWIEIGLCCAAAIFLTLLGLLFSDHAPNWFYELMLNKSKHP
jgi:hypothetical protein